MDTLNNGDSGLSARTKINSNFSGLESSKQNTINWGYDDLSAFLDGSTLDFTIAETPITGTFILTLNGLKITEGIDFTISGTNISLSTAPNAGEALIAEYIY